MSEEELKEKYKRKVVRFKERLSTKDSELGILLEITNAINHNESTLDILEKFELFVKDKLKIEKLILFAKYKRWRCILDYNVEDKEIDLLDIEKDLLHITEIASVNFLEKEVFKNFDMVVPVLHGDRPLAYLILGDVTQDAVGVSSIIKHLNFLQLLTNVIVSAIENQRLAREAIRQEQEKQMLIEKQNDMLEKQVNERTKELVVERDESERLLHNILPVEVANELKQKGYTTAKSYKKVSILFTDFQGFTETSSKITPQELVSELNEIFKEFDAIMGEHGVEKIKTIGDAYMAVCGLPIESKDHALNCINAGKDMLKYLKHRAKTARISWTMRVGIHSGALVAGVVGTKKFTYDVWGDTVNTAARMESGGEPGKINISHTTYKLVKDDFEFEHRGKMLAKGKGEVDMYFVGKGKKYKSKKRKKSKATISEIKKYIIDKLERELPEKLYYHGMQHTIDVFEAAERIAISESVSKEELNLIQVAALFHDSGFTITYKDHEEAGCKLVREVVPGFGYGRREIEQICAMIMATKVPQTAKTKFQKIICDADLDYLGTDRFESIGQSLMQELNGRGASLNVKTWNELQFKFLENHKYYTATCRKSRDPVKFTHLKALKKLLAKV